MKFVIINGEFSTRDGAQVLDQVFETEERARAALFQCAHEVRREQEDYGNEAGINWKTTGEFVVVGDPDEGYHMWIMGIPDGFDAATVADCWLSGGRAVASFVG